MTAANTLWSVSLALALAFASGCGAAPIAPPAPSMPPYDGRSAQYFSYEVASLREEPLLVGYRQDDMWCNGWIFWDEGSASEELPACELPLVPGLLEEGQAGVGQLVPVAGVAHSGRRWRAAQEAGLGFMTLTGAGYGCALTLDPQAQRSYLILILEDGQLAAFERRRFLGLPSWEPLHEGVISTSFQAAPTPVAASDGAQRDRVTAQL